MKTKLTLILTAIYAIIAVLHSFGVIEVIPVDNEQVEELIKLIVALFMAFLNGKYTDPKEVRKMFR